MSTSAESILARSVAVRVGVGPGSYSDVEYWGYRLAGVVVCVWLAGIVLGFRVSLSVLNLLGFGMAAVGILRPAVGVLGVGMLCTIDALSRVFLMRDGFWRYNSFNYLLLLAMLVALPVAVRMVDRHTRLLQSFLVVLALGLLISPERRLGVLNILGVVAELGILVYFLRACRDPKVYLWLGLVNGLLAAVGSVVFYRQIYQLPYINSNAWAYFPLTGLFSICVGYRFTKPSSPEQILMILLGSLNVVWIFLSGSRGGMFVGACCMVFIMRASRGLSRRAGHILMASLLVGLLSGAAVLGLFPTLREHSLQRLMKLFDSKQSLDSRTSGRSSLMLAGWQMFLDNPLGVGTGGFGARFSSAEYKLTGKDLQAHSAWIKTLAENGILGISILAAFVASFAKAGWRKRKQGYFPLGCLVTIALCVAFLSTEFQGKGLWFLAAAVTSLFSYQPEIIGVAAQRLGSEELQDV